MKDDAPKQLRAEPVFIEIGKTIDIGKVDDAAATGAKIKAAPIRLCEGFGGPKGYGLTHVEENEDRVAQLNSLGFETSKDAIAAVAARWQVVAVANEPNRVVLVLPHRARYLRLVVQLCLSVTGNYWSVVTIVPGRRVKPADVLYVKKEETAG
ncbi:hypothetical protein JQ543_05025 [Bradyrhizobium diazoefficiens]|nr:hypothetical protein [Bradyrhizobium diazoefficiens]MBR0847103.1 hypothetical protein [Bradyrhizobium diazoefficiens]